MSSEESQTPARVLIADDHVILRDGLRALIERLPGWDLCGETDNGRDAVRLAEELKPDVAILDMHMPGLNGLEATRQIKRAVPETEILIFTGLETDELVLAVFEAGARSYLLKNDSQDQIAAALESLRQHKPFFTTQIGEIVFARFLEGNAATRAGAEAGRLTAREREIVQLLAEGASNKDVADKLGISVKTAETHRAAIMKKLKFKSFAELMRYAIRNLIIEA